MNRGVHRFDGGRGGDLSPRGDLRQTAFLGGLGFLDRIRLADGAKDGLLRGLLKLAGDYQFVENGICTLEVEDQI